MPKVSVIVPCYNVEAFLDRCVSSIQNQTLLDIEIILIDDGSKDGTVAMCDEFAEKDERIHVIHQKNAGPSEARNAGLAVATGEYIGFVDSDDFIHPQMYEILYNAAVKNGAEVVIGDACQVTKMPCFEQYDENNTQQNPISREQYVKNMFSASTIDWKWISVWNKLYKREICKDIRFRNLSCEDGVFNCDALKNAKVFIQVQCDIYYWQENPASISRGTFSKHQMESVDAYETMRQMCIAMNPGWGCYPLEKEVKKVMAVRCDAAGTDKEKAAKEISVAYRKKLVRPLLTEKRISKVKKAIYCIFLYVPFSYRLFRGLHLKMR